MDEEYKVSGYRWVNLAVFTLVTFAAGMGFLAAADSPSLDYLRAEHVAKQFVYQYGSQQLPALEIAPAVVHGRPPQPLVGVVLDQVGDEGQHGILGHYRDASAFALEPVDQRRGIRGPATIGKFHRRLSCATKKLKGANIMRLKNLFTRVNDMNTEQLKTFIDANEEGSFTLLDVRQPAEYETARIPGSTLIPLPSLEDRLKELDPQKPVIAY